MEVALIVHQHGSAEVAYGRLAVDDKALTQSDVAADAPVVADNGLDGRQVAVGDDVGRRQAGLVARKVARQEDIAAT